MSTRTKELWKQRLYKTLIVILAVCLGFGSVVWASAQETTPPQNPIAEPLIRQFTPVNLTPLVEVDEDLIAEDATISDAESEETDEAHDFGGLPSQSGDKGEIGPGSGTTSSAGDGSQFFNVVIDETPTVPKWLDFYLVHYNSTEDYQPLEVSVSTNGGTAKTYAPDAVLGVQLDGAYAINTVAVSVTYLKPDGTKITPSPVIRRIPIVGEALEFFPQPPETFETTQGTYVFTLTAHYLDTQTNEVKLVTPRVFCGGKEYFQDSAGYYHVHLARGENAVTMQAEARNNVSIEAQTLVTYKAVDVEVNIDPYPFPKIIYDNPAYSFRVWLTQQDPEVRLQVFHKNVEIKPVGDTYNLNLSYGHNKIDIIASRPYGGEMQAVVHQIEDIEYRRWIDPEEDQTEDPGMFTITDFTLPQAEPDGYIHVNYSPLVFTMRVFDYLGQPVYQSNITVEVNGRACLMRQEWSGLYEYEVPLNEGHNELKIKLRDDLQRQTTLRYLVWYDPSKPGGVIGQANIVVDASEIGLGVIASGTADIVEGEPAAYQIQSVLEQSGFEFNFSGSPNTDFYLAHIISPGITNNVQISDEVKEQFIKQELWNDTYYQDSLGERDFTNTSGWWVYLGGEAPTRGLSSIYLKDGDTLYVQFRLNN